MATRDTYSHVIDEMQKLSDEDFVKEAMSISATSAVSAEISRRQIAALARFQEASDRATRRMVWLTRIIAGLTVVLAVLTLELVLRAR